MEGNIDDVAPTCNHLRRRRQPWPTHPQINLLLINLMLALYDSHMVDCLSANISSASITAVIQIGALLDASVPVGSRCLDALRLAVSHVNTDPMLLNGTQLQLLPADSNCSAFSGAAAATWLLQSEVVAIVGPQSSEVSHFVAHMAAHTRVPLVSFAATDPELSEHQYPYFSRLAWNDVQQMSAVASVVDYYGWRRVVALFADNDDAGQNAVDVLSDLLVGIGSTLAFKASLSIGGADDDQSISRLLMLLNMTVESRVYIVHMSFSSTVRSLFLVANRLHMMSAGYVWIVTHSITEALSLGDLQDDIELLNAMQGVVGICMYVDASGTQLQTFLTQRNVETGRTDRHYYAIELLAYESVKMIAYALDRFLKQGHSLSFNATSLSEVIINGTSTTTDLAQLKILNEGADLLSYIRETSFDDGITGNVKLDERGDSEGIAFEVMNMRTANTDVAEGMRSVGYWFNGTLSSVAPIDSNYNNTNTMKVDVQLELPSATAIGQALGDVVWPGGSSQVPRGWMLLPEAMVNGQRLTIGVPKKSGYTEFVTTMLDSVSGKTVFRGFCIDVFETARQRLPYSFDYDYVSFGDGHHMPNYSDLVAMVANKKFDAVVGDVTITPARSKLVDFTQPYTTSGLVVVVPRKSEWVAEIIHAWAFMHPFTPAMWCTTGAFFLLTGIVIWILERKKNKAFRGRPNKQFVTTLWFIFSTLFFSQRENVKSTLGRAVLVIWLFVVLIITSSYTASLTSMLTVEQLSPSIQGIASLVASDVAVGYQAGSFVELYLLQLHISKRRLIPLDTLSSYAHALSLGQHSVGGVGAIVDELPYVQLFLSSHCDFSIAGQEFTKNGWGFAFPKGSQLAIDMSTAILSMSEDGTLQHIHDKWLSNQTCVPKSQPPENELNIQSFWGLFLITGVTSVFCVLCYVIRMAWEYKKSLREAKVKVKIANAPGDTDGSVSGGYGTASSLPTVVADRGAAAVMRKQRSMSTRFRRGASFLKSLAAFIEEAEGTTPGIDDAESEPGISSSRGHMRRSSSSIIDINQEGINGTGCSNDHERPPYDRYAGTSIVNNDVDIGSDSSADGRQRASQAELFQLLRDLSISFKSGSAATASFAAGRASLARAAPGRCEEEEARVASRANMKYDNYSSSCGGAPTGQASPSMDSDTWTMKQ